VLAEQRFTAPAGQDLRGGFATRHAAVAWVQSEREGLVAAVTQAANARPHDAIRLATALSPILSWVRALDDGVTVATAAVEASRDASDPTIRATAWSNLGSALRRVRRFREAIAAHEQALE